MSAKIVIIVDEKSVTSGIVASTLEEEAGGNILYQKIKNILVLLNERIEGNGLQTESKIQKRL